ncbi:MAG: CDP-diacylglycerol--glycerol-3-phosphate 3-phosphatidyltransferase [Rhodospirillaceae bacterium]|nr:MAG: CDP-diacylglycerol--glycerol-3-phosphate 3-phosphatidyltransferase [Rhodospirillaceae bacterium]
MIKPMSVKVIPNCLTLLRLLATPVAVWLIGENMMATAFWLFAAAALTDAVDGAIAKLFNACTRIGGYLDPLADKALLVGVYVSLGFADHLPRWLVILVVFRDIVIVGGAVLYELAIGHLVMRPLLISKVNTLGQIVLASMVLGGHGFDMDIEKALDLMIGFVSGTVVLSAVAYGWVWGRAALVGGDDA